MRQQSNKRCFMIINNETTDAQLVLGSVSLNKKYLTSSYVVAYVLVFGDVVAKTYIV